MKQILFKTFLVASVLFSSKTIYSQCTLDQVGAVNYALYSTYSDMAVAPSGIIYTINYNTSSTKFELYAGQTAASWTLVTSFTSSTTVKPDIAVSSSGKVSVLLRDDLAGKVAKLYYLSGGTLIQQGAAISTSTVAHLSLDFDAAGNEYVAYTDIANSNFSTVKKWASGSSTWVSVGSGIASPGAGFYNSIMLDNTNTPILAFQDATSANRISVIKFNGSIWTSSLVVSANAATNSKLKAASNGDYYLGYSENTGAAIIQKFNGTSWSALGSPVTGLSFAANSFDLDLDPVDVPYFIAYGSTSQYAISYKYTGVPTWSNTIGTGNLNSSICNNVSIFIGKNGTPFFFYVDQSANNALNVKTLSSPLSISPQPVSISRCNGQSGSFNLGVVGGTPISYQWQTASAGTFTNAGAPYTNGTTNTLSFVAAMAMNQNNVRCIVNAGCKNIISNTATLTVVSNPSVSLITTNPTCFGLCNGLITSTPSGGTAPYIYNWSNSAVTSSITNLCAGSYSMTTTDASGCTVTANANVINPASISSSFTGNQTICSGANTTLTITAVNGIPAYTYSWSPATGLSSTTSPVVTANLSAAQTYTIQITDANGCVATNTVMITVNPLPTVSAGTDNTICNGGSTMNTATGTNSYTWNPGNFVGANQIVTPFTTTAYTVVGTNSGTGCTNSDIKIVTVNPNPTVNAVSSPTSICVGSPATLSSTGATTYSWNTGQTTNTISVSPSSTTIFTVTGTTAGCTNTRTISLTVSANPTVTSTSNPAAICVGSTSTLTASGATSYTWIPGSLTGVNIVVTPTASTIYTVIGSTAAGCTNTNTLSLIINANPVATANTSGTLTCSATSAGLNSGSVAGGTYLWNGPGISGSSFTQNTSASIPGNYTVTVTNSGTGCSSTAITTVTQNTVAPSPTASNSGTLTCSTLSVALNGTPAGMTYSWTGPGISGSSTTQNTAANAPGIYSLLVTSPVNGCLASATTAVTQNTTPPTVTASNSGTLTCTTSTVLATGTGGGTYSWSGPGIIAGGGSSSATVNQPGSYFLTATAANGCTNVASTNVLQNIIAPVTNTNVSGILSCTLTSVNASASTTVTPVSYNWTGTGIVSGAGTATINTNTNGVKNYTVTNTSNGCYTNGIISVSQNTTMPTGVSAGSNQTLTCTPSVTLTGSVSTPTNAVINWSGGVCGSPSNIITSACSAGIYTLTATHPVSGCIATSTVQVAPSTGAPAVTANPVTNTLTCTNTLVAVSISTTIAPVSYVWSGAGIVSGATTGTITVNSPGVKNYTVTNTSNGCSSSGSQIVTQNTTTPFTSASITGTMTCITSTVNLNSSLAGETYTWTAPGGGFVVNGTNSQNAIGSGAGTYSLTVVSPINGCTYSVTTSVSQNTTMPVGLSAGSNQTLSCGTFSVSLNGSVTTPTNATFNWTGGVCGSTNSLTTAACVAGIYTLTATNPANGCLASSTVAVFSNTSTPTINTIGTSTITCSVPTATLFTSSNADPTTSYSWTSPFAGMLNNYTIKNPVALAGGVFTVVVTNTINGCAAMATVSVISDISVPTLSLSSGSATLTCLSPTETVTVTSSPSSLIYNWTPASGIIAGTEMTSTPVFSAPGSYSVVVTNTINGCSNSNNVLIFQDFSLPAISISASPSTICSGNSSTLTATGAVSYVWSSGPTSSSIVVSPTTSITYTVTGTGANGCSDIATQFVVVNASPTLAVSGNTNICKGSSTSLTANGATAYTWSTGENAMSISVTPSITSTYTVTGYLGACFSSSTSTVSIIPSKNISGIITSTAGTTNGDVIIYKYVSALSKWDSITIVPFTSSYSFTGLDSGLYVVRAIPTATNIQVTYGTNSISWQNATVINHGCSNNSSQNIGLIALESIGIGPGVITGTITEGDGFGKRTLSPGSPIGGIIVKGGKNPGGQMFVQTITDTAGVYTLQNLPVNTGSESYFVYVDIPGLDTNGTYHVIVSSGNTQFSNLNFYVDSMYINPNIVTFINQENVLADNKISIFPNPASQFVSIKYEVLQPADVKIEIYDILGHKVLTVSDSHFEKEKYIHKINTEQFSSGVYFIKVKINTSESTIKLIITD
ncbi:MAG: T9SS type A sorting domain-containing protein [Bacteroidota bacterium]